MANEESWWNGANDFLGNLATTTSNVNNIKATVDNFGMSKTELALQEANLKALQEQSRLNYQAQTTATKTAENLGISTNTLLIGGAILGAFLLLG